MKPFRFLFCRGCFIPPLASTLGCELAATVDRSQIGNGGEGGMGGMGGMGGTGGISCDPAACPAASNECVDVVCNADGTCGESPKADGPATTQVAGDCKQSLCKAGPVVDENDDADIAIDGNECTDDVLYGRRTLEPASASRLALWSERPVLLRWLGHVRRMHNADAMSWDRHGVPNAHV